MTSEASVLPARASPPESALQLPFDRHRTPTTPTELAGHAFPLIVPADSSAVDARLAAAFGVLLFRYNAQTSIPLDVSRVSAAGEPRWMRRFDLSIAAGASCASVLDQAGDFLRRMDAGTGDLAAHDRRPEGARAAITFVDSKAGREFRDGADALRFIAASTLESRDADLHLVVANSGGSVSAAFLYNSHLFKPSSIERFAGHLRGLSSRIAVDPAAPVAALPLLTREERLWIESVCSGAPRASPAEFVHRSFERQAAAAPEATAVRFRDQSLTYRRLNSRANALARRLAANGIGPESRVVVCFEPSFDAVIALLAVLKAGGVYVPLDPGYPAARIRASLEDIQPRLIITRASLGDKVSADGVPSLAADDLDGLLDGFSGENLELSARPEQTAYIYYTSGTTGKPKGAAASQANLASYIGAARERYGIDKSDVMPAIARFSFSISMFELMSPLAAGGTLVILDRDHILDLDRMSRTLSEVTFFHAGPSLLKNLIRHIRRRSTDFAEYARVRHASSGGDMVSPEVLEGLQQIFSNAEVFVIYGCSEISCMGCTYPAGRGETIERTFVGRPFDGMSVRVLDAAMNLVPVGVVGEIHFAGDGVVKGYLNRPELTAEKFVDLDGRRFYRTGDMGRLSEDGWLEILGRSDFQVKLRGMRIELGEVEHHLRRAAGVRDGVVTTRQLGGDEKSLVAYVVLDPGGGGEGRRESPIASIRRYMAEHLPDYMLPAAFVELETLPLNHNMKVDRRALPHPEASQPRAASEPRFREPRTDTENRLASLWKKLLGLDRVGLDDHFFDLGGHSVLGITLILDVESAVGVVLTGMEVLRESLEEQAAICDRRLGKPAAAAAKPAADAAAGSSDDFEAFHFGEARSLYGVLSGAAAAERRRDARGAGEIDAVLVCSPIGQEHSRTHFILRRLAQRLAAQGVPTLRFDYFGCGDSLGESVEATCGRWRRDIVQAHEELRRRVGAERIAAVGVRVGAALLADVADDLDIARLVLWDPVCDGSRYCAETAETHELFLGRWRRLFRPPPCVEGAAELLGLACSETTLGELKALVFAPNLSGRSRPVRWLATSDVERQARQFRNAFRERDGSRLETMNFDPDWNGISRIGDLLPDVGISGRLAAMATEPA
ncbi:MAG: amino acid adenylation domain-containing protein [Elusimicrobiota bacterium]